MSLISTGKDLLIIGAALKALKIFPFNDKKEVTTSSNTENNEAGQKMNPTEKKESPWDAVTNKRFLDTAEKVIREYKVQFLRPPSREELIQRLHQARVEPGIQQWVMKYYDKVIQSV